MMLKLSCMFLCLWIGACASGNRPLQLIAGQGPIYPVEAKAEQVEGWVVVGYDVSRDGRVINARVVEAQPPRTFDAAALAAVQSWKFNAPQVNGEPQVTTNLESRVEFRLGRASEYDNY